MEYSIALVTGATSGIGYATASILAAKGFRQVFVTGQTLARAQETATRLAVEFKSQVFTPLELDLDAPTSVTTALAKLAVQGRPIAFLLLNAGWIGAKERVLTASPAWTYLNPSLNRSKESSSERTQKNEAE